MLVMREKKERDGYKLFCRLFFRCRVVNTQVKVICNFIDEVIKSSLSLFKKGNETPLY